ncbi:MAG: hypothetical protein C4547_03685 [Phycisphaerales bacterium]|nr:MAG: hypothetical protein C4547_03685 [Phycisphaerales bacterium]
MPDGPPDLRAASPAGPAAGQPDTAPADADLARIVSAWPGLPEPIRRAMRALADAGALEGVSDQQRNNDAGSGRREGGGAPERI